jgi:hypothetical protein
MLALVLGVALAALAEAAMLDAWITTKTKLALMTAAGVRGRAINVNTVFGRVTLHGTADEVATAKRIIETTGAAYTTAWGRWRRRFVPSMAKAGTLSRVRGLVATRLPSRSGAMPRVANACWRTGST